MFYNMINILYTVHYYKVKLHFVMNYKMSGTAYLMYLATVGLFAGFKPWRSEKEITGHFLGQKKPSLFASDFFLKLSKPLQNTQRLKNSVFRLCYTLCERGGSTRCQRLQKKDRHVNTCCFDSLPFSSELMKPLNLMVQHLENNESYSPAAFD